ncbi:MAG: ATP-binding cassette domain-containing protein [Tannerella sp.]|jgi:ABC-type lipoprotein export system ATPase subunit|nr:ATP-binding cassette domain-containing protein [Tannerella sp.]
MLQLIDIEKSYPDGAAINYVLRRVNMTVTKGEFVAVTGESGAGKTTLLGILGLLVVPDKGTYVLDGEDITLPQEQSVKTSPTYDAATLRNRKIGFMFQEHLLLPQFTVMQNILLPTLACRKTSSPEQVRYAEYLVNMTDIEGLANRLPTDISGGEASRVALCRALIMKPLLLLADEPTGQLDSRNARNIVALLKKINRELGTTVVLVSHSKETTSEAERILTLKDGVLL